MIRQRALLLRSPRGPVRRTPILDAEKSPRTAALHAVPRIPSSPPACSSDAILHTILAEFRVQRNLAQPRSAVAGAFVSTGPPLPTTTVLTVPVGATGA